MTTIIQPPKWPNDIDKSPTVVFTERFDAIDGEDIWGDNFIDFLRHPRMDRNVKSVESETIVINQSGESWIYKMHKFQLHIDLHTSWQECILHRKSASEGTRTKSPFRLGLPTDTGLFAFNTCN